MTPGFGLPNEQGGAGQEGSGRWGSLPARLRWSVPDYNKTEQLERPMPRTTINAWAPVPICSTSRSRHIKLPSIGSPRCGTGEVYSKIAGAFSDEGLQERADLKNLRGAWDSSNRILNRTQIAQNSDPNLGFRSALDSSNRIVEGFREMKRDVWPDSHRWGSQQRCQPPNHFTNHCSFYDAGKSRLQSALARRLPPDNFLQC